MIPKTTSYNFIATSKSTLNVIIFPDLQPWFASNQPKNKNCLLTVCWSSNNVQGTKVLAMDLVNQSFPQWVLSEPCFAANHSRL